MDVRYPGVRRIASVVALVAVVALAGCVGGDEDGADTVLDPTGDEDVARDRADLSGGFGTIKGVVTDSAVQPVAQANVTVVELERSAQTRSDGTFQIGNVPPGSYTVRAGTGGFVPAAETVTVVKGQAATVDFILAKIAQELPYVQEFEMRGLVTYGWGVGWNVSALEPVGLETFWVRDNNCDYDELAGPECRGEFQLDPPLDSLIFEMTWEASSPLEENMMAMMRVSDNAPIIDGTWQFFMVEGPSPLYHRMDTKDIDAVMANFTERCDNGEDEFCGLGFRDEGFPLQTRVWPGWQCPVDQAGFCAVLELEYGQFVSAFYHEQAPAGYTLVG